jgi:hypothetical protein
MYLQFNGGSLCGMCACVSYVSMGGLSRDLHVLKACLVESLQVVSFLHLLGVSCILGTNSSFTLSLCLAIMFKYIDHVSLGS